MRYLALLLFAICAHGGDERPLFVFVGEKISVEALPHGDADVEFGFTATYRNLKNVHGELPLEAIEFTGFDEFYTPPRFAKYDHVLVYVYLADGKYRHVNHLYSPLYLLKEGKWAGPYDWEGYHHKANVDTKIKPLEMEFPESATRVLLDAQVEHLKYYPEIYVPQYRVDGNKMIPVMGNYLEELLALNKSGVLRDMGWFE